MLVRNPMAVGPRCFSITVDIPSGPMALEFLDPFMAVLTSYALKGGVSSGGRACYFPHTFW